MNIRVNPTSGIAEIQVDEDEWRPVEDVAADASKENKSLRNYILEHYGRVIERTVPRAS